MSILRFTDGEEFDTSGAFRKEDGWYVIGHGNLIPVASEKEASDTIWRLTFHESC